jgi:hypothetical protein
VGLRGLDRGESEALGEDKEDNLNVMSVWIIATIGTLQA